MTRFWFALSMGGEGSEDWLQETIVDVQEIIPSEIWCITMHKHENMNDSSTYNAHTRMLYVLEATCEVVGHPPATIEPAGKKPTIALRADWSAYIHKHASQAHPTGIQATSALIASHLKWANFEEYDRGISRLWLKRAAAEGEMGTAKLTVAWRYVFACVVGNRYLVFSGAQWLLTSTCTALAGLGRVHQTWHKTSQECLNVK